MSLFSACSTEDGRIPQASSHSHKGYGQSFLIDFLRLWHFLHELNVLTFLRMPDQTDEHDSEFVVSIYPFIVAAG